MLVYAWDRRDPAKRAAARAWLEVLFASGRGRLSWQVLHEFQSAASRKLNSAPWEIREFVETLALWGPVDTSIQLVRDAWEWTDRSTISYWDALIVAGAIRQDAKWLLTEDLQAAGALSAAESPSPVP